jgi:hypothetical protein
MTEDTKTRKSGRTAEQQAEREARKAAKKAAKGAKEAGTEAVAEVATDAADNTTEGAPEASTSTSTSRKRRAQDEDDADLLEIDLSAHAPMSKADLRAAKKRAKSGLPPLPPKTSAGEGSDAIEGEDKGEGAPRSRDSKPKEKPQAKGEFSIWIGNLSFRTAAEGLREFLVQGITEMGGEVDCITRVHMPKKGDKGSFAQNKG